MKNKFFYTVFIVLFLSGKLAYSQPLALKEHFDAIEKYYVTDINYADGNQPTFADKSSWLMLAYINMYEATKDKAYLVKFMNHAIAAQVYRYDQQHLSDPTYPPKWTLDPTPGCQEAESSYLNGLMIYPMAKFIYMVITDNNLKNTPLPIHPYYQLIDMDALNTMQPSTMITYGDFARWLGKRVEQTLAYTNLTLWDDNLGFLKNAGCDRAAELNWNSCYGAALVYMGMLNNNFPTEANFGFDTTRIYYLDKASRIATFYHGDQSRRENCLDDWLNICSVAEDKPVLKELPNYSYSWRHAGWRNLKCIEKCNNEDYIEDASHAGMSLFFPIEAYKLGTGMFTTADMIKFRNTFTKNIYYTLNGEQQFHAAVNGTNTNFFNQYNVTSGEGYWGEVLAMSILYRFDGINADAPPPNVYDIFQDHINDIIEENLDGLPGYPTPNNGCYGNLSGFISLYGFSEYIKAQWEKECVNLTLKNRQITYDQDFIVKNNILIDPSLDNDIDCYDLLNTESFADPLIIDSAFTIESGATVNLISGKCIVGRAGFHAKKGSHARAYIDPNLSCNNPSCKKGNSSDGNGREVGSQDTVTVSVPVTTTIEEEQSKNVKKKNNTTSEQQSRDRYITLTPNPATKEVRIDGFSYGEPTEIIITNAMGQEVSKAQAQSNHCHINVEKFPAGIYFVTINTGGETYHRRFVKK